jgi:hypothetical protein
VTRGGQEFPRLYYVRRRLELDFQLVAASDLWTYVDDLDQTARLGGNVLVVPNPASADINRESLFGRLKARSDVGYLAGLMDRRTWRATVTERL